MTERPLSRFAWLATAAAVATLGLKTGAWALTGSVGFLSDALESVVNLAGALMALAMLTIAARPEDEDHAFGHSKAEYFSSGVEGALILAAAAGIGFAAFERLRSPRPLEQIGVGLIVSLAASLINLAVALLLSRAARRHGSITFEASSHHLMTDVWTSLAVIGGVGAVALTGWQRLDSVVALAVAGNILWTGIRIARESIAGLMDRALPADEQEKIRQVLESHRPAGASYHALRTRRSGVRRFVSLHVLVPGGWTVQRGHQLLERIEADVRAVLPNTSVFTHLEPLDDPASFADIALDRKEP